MKEKSASRFISLIYCWCTNETNASDIWSCHPLKSTQMHVLVHWMLWCDKLCVTSWFYLTKFLPEWFYIWSHFVKFLDYTSDRRKKKPYKPIKIIQGKWNCNIYSQVISKGYLHSTILIHNLRIGFSNVKQNKALAGLTFWFCCFRGGARFRVIVLVFPTLAVAAPSAAAHAELSGLLLFESVRIVMPPPGCGLE